MRHHSFPNLLRVLLGFLFLYTCGFKFFFPGEATTALETLGLPTGLAEPMVAAATAAEIYVGLLLIFGIDLRYTITFSIVMMSIFTAYLFYLSTLAHPPACGCTGLTGIFNSSRHAAIFGVGRNCLILWMLKIAHDMLPRSTVPASAAGEPAAT